MKKLLITAAVLFIGTAMYAQPAMTITNNNTNCSADIKIYATDAYISCGAFYTNTFTLPAGGGNVFWASYVANLNNCFAPIHYIQACPPPNHLDVPTGYWEAVEITIGGSSYIMNWGGTCLGTANGLQCLGNPVSVTTTANSITIN